MLRPREGHHSPLAPLSETLNAQPKCSCLGLKHPFASQANIFSLSGINPVMVGVLVHALKNCALPVDQTKHDIISGLVDFRLNRPLRGS